MDDARLEELTTLTNEVGLKSIKTEKVSVDLHSPTVVQKLKERLSEKPVLFSNFPMTRATPNHAAYDRCKELEVDECQ